MSKTVPFLDLHSFGGGSESSKDSRSGKDNPTKNQTSGLRLADMQADDDLDSLARNLGSSSRSPSSSKTAYTPLTLNLDLPSLPSTLTRPNLSQFLSEDVSTLPETVGKTTSDKDNTKNNTDVRREEKVKENVSKPQDAAVDSKALEQAIHELRNLEKDTQSDKEKEANSQLVKEVNHQKHKKHNAFSKDSTPLWMWIVGGLLVAAIVVAVYFYFRKKQEAPEPEIISSTQTKSSASKNTVQIDGNVSKKSPVPPINASNNLPTSVSESFVSKDQMMKFTEDMYSLLDKMNEQQERMKEELVRTKAELFSSVELLSSLLSNQAELPSENEISQQAEPEEQGQPQIEEDL